MKTYTCGRGLRELITSNVGSSPETSLGASGPRDASGEEPPFSVMNSYLSSFPSLNLSLFLIFSISSLYLPGLSYLPSSSLPPLYLHYLPLIFSYLLLNFLVFDLPASSSPPLYLHYLIFIDSIINIFNSNTYDDRVGRTIAGLLIFLV